MDKTTANAPNNISKTTKARRQTFIIPKRTIAERYPFTFIWTLTVGGLLVFFSRPLYDAFIRTDFPESPPPEQRREILRKAWKI